MEIAIILMMLLLLVSVGAIKLADNGVAFPFKRRQQLFTPVEHTFLNLLEQSVGREFRIVCRVKLNDLVQVRQASNKKQATAALSRATGKQLDFVLCDRRDMSPVLAIDLVHKNSNGSYKAQRDWFTTGALDAAGVPHARIKVKSGYSTEEIKECVESKLVAYRKRQTREAQPGVHNPAPNTRPTRPLRSSRPAAA